MTEKVPLAMTRTSPPSRHTDLFEMQQPVGSRYINRNPLPVEKDKVAGISPPLSCFRMADPSSPSTSMPIRPETVPSTTPTLDQGLTSHWLTISATVGSRDCQTFQVPRGR